MLKLEVKRYFFSWTSYNWRGAAVILSPPPQQFNLAKLKPPSEYLHHGGTVLWCHEHYTLLGIVLQSQSPLTHKTPPNAALGLSKYSQHFKSRVINIDFQS